MRQVAFLLVAIITGLLIVPMAAATLPCAANSICELSVLPRNGSACADADLRWCPAGDFDSLVVRITVRGCLNDPVDTCAVKLEIIISGDPQDELGTVDMSICGGSGGTATFYDTTDANGAAEFWINGGGCGRAIFAWTSTALCASPPVELCSETDTLCIKSPDMTGDLRILFTDTFKFLEQLDAGSGYCADFSCDGGVNFVDTNMYLPHLGGGHSCSGDTLSSASLQDCE